MTNQEVLDAMNRVHAGAGFEGKGHMLYPWSADAAISDVQELCRLFAREIQRLTREECAKHLERMAEHYAMEFGHQDDGSLSFGSGAGGEIKMNYYCDLVEHAASIRAMED